MYTITAKNTAHALVVLENRPRQRMPRHMWTVMTCLLRHGTELEKLGMVRRTKNEVVLVPDKIPEDIRGRMKAAAKYNGTWSRV